MNNLIDIQQLYAVEQANDKSKRIFLNKNTCASVIFFPIFFVFFSGVSEQKIKALFINDDEENK